MTDPRDHESDEYREDAVYDYGLDPDESFEPEDDEEPLDLGQPHVMTVLGPVDPAALGFALHHEHVYCPTDLALINGDADLRLDDPSNAVDELEFLFAAGGRAVVDMSPADLGRDARIMLEIAQHVPVHLIVVTGHHKHQFAAPYASEDSIEVITARNVREVTDGIDGTGVRAGAIKAGTSLDAMSEVEERVLRAAARSHLLTGAPISTHTERGTMALEQLRVLTDEGVDPRRVILGHLDFQLDNVAYLREVAATGAFISFDQWSKTKYATDVARACALYELAAAGHLDQLLISGDFARKSYHVSYGGSPGFAYFCDHVPLILMEAGFDAPSVRRIFVENPARALTTQRPR